jgi:hypothetical protein
MGRVLSLVAVLAIGWAAATLTLYYGFKMAFGFLDKGPHATTGAVLMYIGMALVPAAPAVAASRAAHYGWTIAAWVFGLLAAALAVILGYWLQANATS